MSVCLTAHIVDNGEIKVSHQFWGETEEECEEYMQHHMNSCSYFKSNVDAGNVFTELDDDADRPEPEDFEDDEDN